MERPRLAQMSATYRLSTGRVPPMSVVGTRSRRNEAAKAKIGEAKTPPSATDLPIKMNPNGSTRAVAPMASSIHP